MSDSHRPEFSDRLVELCSDYVSEGGPVVAELNELDPDSSARMVFEAAAAAIDIGYAESDDAPMPAGLVDALKSAIPVSGDAKPELKLSGTHAEPAAQPQVAGRISWTPWLIAAACLALAAAVVFTPGPTPSAAPSLADQRSALIESAGDGDLVQWTWISTEDPSAQGGVAGDVVWSDAEQKGYMTFKGLALNDPTTEQYQLWIFDATRPDGALPQFGEGLLSQRPVDGGVFDITEEGDVIIPIDAKLAVGQAAAFAITVEPPGGVVVSDRSRVPVLALAPQG